MQWVSRFFAASVSLLFLIGCAVHPRYFVGEALLKGETPTLPSPPDSLRAELELTAFSGGDAGGEAGGEVNGEKRQKSSVTAALSAKPRVAYKLDIYGFPGTVAASFLWQNNAWTLVIYDRENFVKGEGEHVEFGNLGIHEVSIHNIFAFLWGDFFPGIASQNNLTLPITFKRVNANQLEYTTQGQSWKATLEPRTGLVHEVVREDSAFRIHYVEYKILSGRTVPSKVEIYSRSGLLLEIKVKSLQDRPHWSRDPFFIKVPKSFRALVHEAADRTLTH